MEYTFYCSRSRRDNLLVTREKRDKTLPQVAIALTDSARDRYVFYQVEVCVGEQLGQKKHGRGSDFVFDVSSFAEIKVPRWPTELGDSMEVEYWGNEKLLKLIVERALPSKNLDWRYEPPESGTLGIETPYTRLHFGDIRTEKLGVIVQSLFQKYEKLKNVTEKATRAAIRRTESRLRVA